MGIKNWQYDRCVSILGMLWLDQVLEQDENGLDVTLGDKIIDSRSNLYGQVLDILLNTTKDKRTKKLITWLGEGYTLQEIAKKLHCSRTTINSMLKQFKQNVPIELKNNLLRGEI